MRQTTADRLADFVSRHGYQVTNALQNQEQHMRDAVKEAEQSYKQAVPVFTEAAEQAAAAEAAWQELTAIIEEAE